MTAMQPIAAPKPALIFTFICGDCAREERSATDALPTGWNAVVAGCAGAPFIRCPDCATRIDQDAFRRWAEMTAAPPAPANDVAPISIGMDAAKTTVPDYAAAVFLERQPDGRLEIVMTPDGLMMRMFPPMWYFSPAAARAAAAELRRMAWLAEHPDRVTPAHMQGAPA